MKKFILLLFIMVSTICLSLGLSACGGASANGATQANIREIELGYTVSQVKEILGSPDEEDAFTFTYYDGEYKSLLRQQQKLENKLLAEKNEEEFEKILNQIFDLEEKMNSLDYSYTQILFDLEKQVNQVLYNAQYKADETSYKSISNSEVFPKLISALSNPSDVNYVAKENYTDGSYYYGSVYPDTSSVNTFKSGEYRVKWSGYLSKKNSKDCGDTVIVGKNISSGTKISGTFGNYTFKATIDNICTLESMQLNITLEGTSDTLAYDNKRDIYWEAIRSNIIDITIPNSVKSIANKAFSGCSELVNITIPDSVTTIGDEAFSGCKNLKNLSLGKNVMNVGTNAFPSTIETATLPATACEFSLFSNLKTVVITDGNCIRENSFYHCSNLTNITIPTSITNIADGAFKYCAKLKDIIFNGNVASWCSIEGLRNLPSKDVTLYIDGQSVTGDFVIPDNVASICDYAFSGCSDITSVTIPNSVTFVGYHAFSDCSNLTSVTIGKGLKNIDNSFEYCEALTDFYYTGDISSWCKISGLDTFKLPEDCNRYIDGKELSGNLIIPSNVQSICDGAFAYCSKLTSISIPNTVESIGGAAFYRCSGLLNIIIPNSVINIGIFAFRYCNELTIYCEAESKPAGWDSEWNISDCPVEWGYKC